MPTKSKSGPKSKKTSTRTHEEEQEENHAYTSQGAFFQDHQEKMRWKSSNMPGAGKVIDSHWIPVDSNTGSNGCH